MRGKGESTIMREPGTDSLTYHPRRREWDGVADNDVPSVVRRSAKARFPSVKYPHLCAMFGQVRGATGADDAPTDYQDTHLSTAVEGGRPCLSGVE